MRDVKTIGLVGGGVIGRAGPPASSSTATT